MTINRYILLSLVVLSSAFVTVNSANASRDTLSFKVTPRFYSVPPDVVIPADTTICEGEQAILEVTANPNNADISWSNGVINGQPFTPDSLGVNDYVLTISDGVSTITDTVKVTVLPNHTIEPAATTTICEGETLNIAPLSLGGGASSVQLSGSFPPGATVLVQGGALTIQGTPTSAGVFNFSITTTGNACTPASTNGTITVNPQPDFALTSGAATLAQEICAGDSITPVTLETEGITDADFDGLPPGVTGTLENHQVLISGTPSVTGQFNYTITLTGPCGNTDETGSVEINEAPTADAGIDETVCTDNPTVDLNGAVTNAAGQQWSSSDGEGSFDDPDSLSASFNPVPLQLEGGAVYLVLTTIGAAAGCENAADSILVSFTEAFSAHFSFDGPFCNDFNQEVLPDFNGTEGGVYGGEIADIDALSGAFNPAVIGAGTFEVTYTVPDSGGCPQFDTAHVVTINPSLENVSSGNYPDTAFCNEATFALSGNADNASGFQWSASQPEGVFDNPDGADAEFSPEGISGTVILTFTALALEGCADASDSVELISIPALSGNLTDTPESICENTTFTFASADAEFNDFFTFQWSLTDSDGAAAGTIDGAENSASVTFNLDSFSEENLLTLSMQADINGECQVVVTHEFPVLPEPEICDFFELAGDVLAVNTCPEDSEENFFQWGCGDNLLEGETSNYLVYTPYTSDCADFWVSVSLYQNGDCPVFAGNDFPTDVDNSFSPEDITLYPNPATTVLNVKFSTEAFPALFDYSIFDLSGRLISGGASPAGEGHLQIDISGVPSGSHILSIRTADFAVNKPFIVLKQ